MKAVLSKEVGGPETLVVEDVAAPVPGKGEVLVRVAACAITWTRSAFASWESWHDRAGEGE